MLALVFLSVSLFIIFGYEKTWKLLNIPTMMPYFADIRTITGGAESKSLGYDPMIYNPGDPWGRPLNYPRLWQCLYLFGIDQSNTLFFGILIIVLFILGVILLLKTDDNILILLTIISVISPSVLLGIERGNTDLLIFFFVTISILLIKKSRLIYSSIFILIGFLLKLYPIFTVFLLIKQKKKYSVFIYTFLITTLLGLYFIFNYSDLSLIAKGTSKGTEMSYGMDILWVFSANFDSNLSKIIRTISYLVVVIVPVSSYWVLKKMKGFRSKIVSNGFIDFFLGGAAIYVGTFLLGNNWDYRLVFLIFVIPQLYEWSINTSTGVIKFIAIFLIINIYIAQWGLIYNDWLVSIPYGLYIYVIVNQSAKWIVFVGLLFLIIWVTPFWYMVKRKDPDNEMNFDLTMN